MRERERERERERGREREREYLGDNKTNMQDMVGRAKSVPSICLF